MQNILLLTDFTAKSKNAQHYTCQLLKGQTCTFHFLSIQKIWEFTMDDLMGATYVQSLDDVLLGDNRIMVNDQIKNFNSKYQQEDFTFKGSVDYDDFIHSVNQAVDKFDIDLVVIGTDGKTGIIEAIFSSHTLSVVRKVDCPILIIPEGFEFEKPTSVQYLLDYDDSFNVCGKDLLLELVKKYKSIIHVIRFNYVFVIEPIDYKKEQEAIIKYFYGTPITYETHLDEATIIVIEQSLITASSQMQVLSAGKESFIESIFSDSHLSKIVNAATVPLLILRDCDP